MEQLTESYESKLRQEREATLRLKFENGIKKRTFTSLTKVGSSFAKKGREKVGGHLPTFSACKHLSLLRSVCVLLVCCWTTRTWRTRVRW